jgi:ABC-type phosphate/phosphonate transport system substrate-binding protein
LDPGSDSGWLVTAAALAQRTLSLERFFAQTIFTYGHRNVVRAVASGLVMSGSIDGGLVISSKKSPFGLGPGRPEPLKSHDQAFTGR